MYTDAKTMEDRSSNHHQCIECMACKLVHRLDGCNTCTYHVPRYFPLVRGIARSQVCIHYVCLLRYRTVLAIHLSKIDACMGIHPSSARCDVCIRLENSDASVHWILTDLSPKQITNLQCVAQLATGLSGSESDHLKRSICRGGSYHMQWFDLTVK